jgi:hypothetical protein
MSTDDQEDPPQRDAPGQARKTWMRKDRVIDIAKGVLGGAGTGTAGMLLVMVLNNQTLLVQQDASITTLQSRVETCEDMRASIDAVAQYHHSIIEAHAKSEHRSELFEQRSHDDMLALRQAVDRRLQIMEARIDRYANAGP